MADKPVLYYFNARGKMESIRWLLAAAEIDFDEVLLTTRPQYEKLLRDGDLMFQQVPMVDMDGMKLVQTKAILNYIAEKYQLHGKDIKDRVKVNMYSEGLMDLMDMIMRLALISNPEEKIVEIETKAKGRYLPVYEKALSEAAYLVGGKMSMADVQLLECTLMLEEKFPGILDDFPKIQAFKGRMTQINAIKMFLQPGSKRKSPPDERMLKDVMEVLQIKLPFS